MNLLIINIFCVDIRSIFALHRMLNPMLLELEYKEKFEWNNLVNILNDQNNYLPCALFRGLITF